MDLLCLEDASECFIKAYPDPVILDDDRVLVNLLHTEEKYVISSRYFTYIQTDLKIGMRSMVAAWMLEVCEEQNCLEGVFSLAINYLDRFLSVVNIKKTQLQLLGAVCLFLASKMKDNKPISAEKLCMYAAHSITIQELTSWELLVISKLKWDLWAITPHDFLDYILRKLPIKGSYHMIRRHAQTFMTLCATDFSFSMHSPSIIAAASIGTAIKGLMETTNSCSSLNNLIVRLHNITNIDTDVLRSCLDQIEGMVSSNLAAAQKSSPSSSSTSATDSSLSTSDKLAARDNMDSEYTQAETPTDVRDVAPLLDY